MFLISKVGHGRDLLPALQKAKNCGLKLSLHLSEVGSIKTLLIQAIPNDVWISFSLVLTNAMFQVPSQADESELLLNIPPDRIGHGTYLHPEVGGSQSLVDTVRKHNTPLGKNSMFRAGRTV